MNNLPTFDPKHVENDAKQPSFHTIGVTFRSITPELLGFFKNFFLNEITKDR